MSRTQMRDVVIVGAARTAIGKFGGTLAGVPATELGRVAIRAVLDRSGVRAEEVDEVIMGHVLQAGCGLNTARQTALNAGMPVHVPAYTVNKVCASGMKAITLGALAVGTGERDTVVAGGMENMSAAPFVDRSARWGHRLGDGALADVILSDALEDGVAGCSMGMTAENLAADFAISREAQDAFAEASQRKAATAWQEGRFAEEVCPVSVPQRKGEALEFAQDEFMRPDTTVEVLGTLKPAFKQGGTVTAGNASGINDGAAALLLTSADAARERGLQPLARIAGYRSAGVHPTRMGLGPVPATRAALDSSGVALSDIGAIELNEAFAAQSLVVLSELGLDPAIVNMHGGAIALGHPVGASGARIVVTLIHIMRSRNIGLGLATLCVGGGQGMALILDAD